MAPYLQRRAVRASPLGHDVAQQFKVCAGDVGTSTVVRGGEPWDRSALPGAVSADCHGGRGCPRSATSLPRSTTTSSSAWVDGYDIMFWGTLGGLGKRDWDSGAAVHGLEADGIVAEVSCSPTPSTVFQVATLVTPVPPADAHDLELPLLHLLRRSCSWPSSSSATSCCSAASRGEVGARLGATCARAVALRLSVVRGRAIARCGSGAPRPRRCDRVTRRTRLHGDALHDQFIVAIVAAAVRGDDAAVWALGDGAYSPGGDDALGPFADNPPPYLAYDLLGAPQSDASQFGDASRGCACIVATDGVAELGARRVRVRALRRAPRCAAPRSSRSSRVGRAHRLGRAPRRAHARGAAGRLRGRVILGGAS